MSKTKAEMILDQVDIVKLDISIWTSSKKLRPEDLVLANGSKLPPEDLASLGTKKTINPEKLKEFNRIKKEAERICLESGTRFIGGFANPREEIARITKELDELSKKFIEEKEQFLASYTAETEAWMRAHAEFGDAIRRAIEPVGSVASKLRFDYVVFRVTKPDPEQEATLERRACSMSEQLFREIATEANQIVDRSFVGKDTVTARTLNGFRRMRDKLDSLGFLDHRCMPVVDEIDAVLAKLPKNGPYNGSTFHSLFRLGMLLSDAEKIKRHGSGLLNPDIATTDLDIEPKDGSSVSVATENQEQQMQESAQTEPGLPAEDEDDIPGFDDFLAKFNSSKEDEELTQEPAELVTQSEIDQTIDVIDEEFGSLVHDGFPANYDLEQDVFDSAPAVNVDIKIDNIHQDVFGKSEANDFMESGMETVNVAAQPVPVAPVAPSIETDFWF